MITYNPYDPQTQHNPYPLWRRLRDEAPVHYSPELDFYVLTRHDDVLDAMLDPATYISGEGNDLDGASRGSGFLIQMDQPQHTTYRKLLSRVFTPRRVSGLEPFIRGLVRSHLDEVSGRDRFDLIEDYSLRIPLDVIGELLGIPAELRPTIHELSERVSARTPDATGPSEDNLTASIEFQMLLTELVVDRRKHPRDDVITMLLQSEITDDDGRVVQIDDALVAAQFLLLAFAGHETVTKVVGNGAVALWWYPDQRRELVADPPLIGGAVEEMVRWDNPAPYAGRWIRRDVELHGVTMSAEHRVVLVMGSANHDERRYEQPELFDIHRSIERPLGFGFGIHLCLGAALARLEMRIAFEELLARYPEYEIDEAGVVRGPTSMFRGLSHLPVVPNG